jgi:hypothetical protein
MAASVTSALDGWPFLASESSTLRRPNDRHLGRLGQPENLLLDFGQTFKADFDAEIFRITPTSGALNRSSSAYRRSIVCEI